MWPDLPSGRMPERPPRIDYIDLAETLQALSYPARLELLDMLRFPHTAAEVRLAPTRVVPGENPDRAVSKQAVQAHLDKLVDTGLVRVSSIDVGGRSVNQYVANSQRLYAITEELRSVCVRYAGRGPIGDATGTLGGPAQATAASGPRLVLVHGVYEAKTFALSDENAQDGRWVIGRRRGATVSLDYDPFVSSEHAFITREASGFVLHDAPESKNGTLVNWETMPKGSTRRLKAADIIGVGRSLLSFAAD